MSNTDFDRPAIGNLLRPYTVRGMEGELKTSEHW